MTFTFPVSTGLRFDEQAEDTALVTPASRKIPGSRLWRARAGIV
jgi:hypothetical protein